MAVSFLRDFTVPDTDATVAEFLAELENPAWEEYCIEDDVRIWVRNFLEYGGTRAFKGHGVIKCSPPTVLGEIQNIPGRKAWDSLCSGGTLIETISPDTDVVHLSFKYGPAVPRDFCLWRHKIARPDGSFLVVFQSMVHPRCPEQKGFVRGHVHLAGFLLTPSGEHPPPVEPAPSSGSDHSSDNEDSDDGMPTAPKAPPVPTFAPETVVTVISLVDLKGWVPRFVLRHIAVQQPCVIATIRRRVVLPEVAPPPALSSSL